MNPTSNTESAGPQSPDAPTAESAERAEATAPEANASESSISEVVEADGDDDILDSGNADDADGDEDGAEETVNGTSSGLAAASAAVVAVALGIVSLTGTWSSRVGAERENLVGQLHTSQTDSQAKQISELFGDGWHVTAAINGAVALVALIIALVLLWVTQPGAAQRAAWVRPFAVAAVVLGAIGLIMSIGMYYDLFASLPSAPAVPTTPTPPAA